MYIFTKILDTDKYDEIVKAHFNRINQWIDKFGFEAEWIQDYEFENNNTVGMILKSEQTNASVFPIALNKELLLEESSDLDYDIKSTIGHEVGHGIFEFLNDIYDLDDLNEEYIVEEFGRDYANNIFSGNELINILEDYMEEFQ